jgi:hypothetical protein
MTRPYRKTTACELATWRMIAVLAWFALRVTALHVAARERELGDLRTVTYCSEWISETLRCPSS